MKKLRTKRTKGSIDRTETFDEFLARDDLLVETEDTVTATPDKGRQLADIDKRLSALNKPHPDPDCLYHAITLTADNDGNVTFGLHTKWVGWTDETMRHELRKSRLVYADHAVFWQKIGLPYAFIHTVDELMLFLLGGGNALVERKLAESIFSNLLEAEPVVNTGPLGFKSRESVDQTALQRAPTPRLRMEIFKRDNRRCRICGRRPDDNSDLELHIHHIRPWAKGGITDSSNLITLCHTCHNGLKPHEDFSLHNYLTNKLDDPMQAYLLNFSKEVANYRKVGFFGEFADKDDNPQPKRRKAKKTAKKTP